MARKTATITEPLTEPYSTTETAADDTVLSQAAAPAADTEVLDAYNDRAIERLLAAIQTKGLSPDTTLLLITNGLLRHAGKKHAGYDLAREFVLDALLVPQELRAPFVNRVAHFCGPSDEIAEAKWPQFRTKLHTQVIAAAKIVQTVAALFEDWPIKAPLPQQQMELPLDQAPSANGAVYVVCTPVEDFFADCRGEDMCGWSGMASVCVRPLHEPDVMLCPECHELVIPADDPTRTEA